MKHTTYLSSDDCFKGQYRRVKRKGKARQGKARQGKARQGKARQGKARPKLKGNTQHRDNTIQVQYNLVQRVYNIHQRTRPHPRPHPHPHPHPEAPKAGTPLGHNPGAGLGKRWNLFQWYRWCNARAESQ